jgi:hypothetical protein
MVTDYEMTRALLSSSSSSSFFVLSIERRNRTADFRYVRTNVPMLPKESSNGDSNRVSHRFAIGKIQYHPVTDQLESDRC